MNQHTFDKLQLEHVKASLAALCACSLGRELVARMAPVRSPGTVRRWFEQVEQMASAAETAGLPPLGGVHDLKGPLQKASTPAGLDADELLLVRDTLAATRQLTRWVAALPDEATLIARIGARIGDFGPVADQIDRVIDERGLVRDEASEKLLSLRRSMEALREQVKKIFDRLVRQPSVQKILQFPNATVRGDRTVLPLKTAYRGQMRGIVHQSSDSGSTLFIEPEEAVQLNNEMVQLRESERREIARLLSQLSLVVHQNEAGLLASLDAMGVLDLLPHKKVQYMRRNQATCPLVSDGRDLLLNQARHPVLLDLAREAEQAGEPRRKVVPIDVRLGDDFDLLMITGPNTGGKTVTLKTVGLLAVMAQCGIPIPANPGSRMPVFCQIHVDVGDEQSIEQSLSTFSSHLSNILETLTHVGKDSLVLLDELGSGTDPDEGAAIGRAVVDELLHVGCCGIITTHLSALKSIAFSHDRVDNASVDFDVETLRPTYHLRIGEPGNSNAIIIAQRLGMPKRLIKRARSYLSKRSKAMNKAIAATLDSRRQAERARLSANQAMLDAEQQRIHFERERKRLEEQRADQAAWHRWINTLAPGDAVFVRSFEKRAQLVRLHLHRQTAVVTSGALEMEVRLGELTKPE